MRRSLLRIFSVAGREFLTSLASPAAWVFLVLFLVMTGLCTFVASDILAAGQADLGGFFNWMPWLFLLLVPALGMPFWSEERRTGTLELTLSYPVTLSELIFGKYLAGMALLCAALLFTLSVPLTVCRLGSPDLGAVLCGYLGALMIGSAFLSATSFCSALTKSQTASFLLSLMLCGTMVFTGWDRVAVILREHLPAWLADRISDITIIPHYQAFQRGLLDTSEIVYCIAVTLLFLFCTRCALAWSSGGTGSLFAPGVLADRTTWRALGRLIGGIAIAFYCFFCAVYASEAFRIRFDCTSDRAYSLTPLSCRFAKELSVPVQLRFYVSPSSTEMPGMHRQYADRVRWLLTELAAVSAGKIELQIIEPQPDSPEEEAALLDGVQPVKSQTGDRFFLGLAVSSGAKDSGIPFLFPQQENLLEYEVIRCIRNVTAEKKKIVALMSEFPAFGRMPEPQRNISAFAPWHIFREIRDDYLLGELPLDTPVIPEDVDVLLVVHPASITRRGEYAIGRYLARGGKAMIFVDPRSTFAEAEARRDYTLMQKTASDLPTLLPAWGLHYSPDTIAADLTFKLDRIGPSGIRQTIPSALRITGEGISRSDPLLSRLTSVWMNYAGVPDLQKQMPELTFDPVVFTSRKAKTVPESALQEQVFAEFGSEERDPLPLAWHISGRFPDAFPEGVPDNIAKEAERQIRDKTEKPGEVYLFADMDMLILDACFAQAQDEFGQVWMKRISDNATLFQNLLESLAGEPSLAELRSRIPMNRPLKAVLEARERAELQFRDRILKLMRDYEQEKKQAEAIRRTMIANPGRIQLTPDQQRLLESESRREAEIRREMKDFRNLLKKELDVISSRARTFNIVILPGAVILLGLVWSILRRIKGRRRS